MYKVWFDLFENSYDGHVVWNEADVKVVPVECRQNIDRNIAGFLCKPRLRVGY